MSDEPGKWDFTDDYERRMAIVEEPDLKHGWVKHVAWATVAIVITIALCYVRLTVK